MKSLYKLHLISVVAFGVFALLAGGSDDSSSTRSTNSSTAPPSTPAWSPKELAMASAVLDYTWSTDGLIMTANFKVHNTGSHAFKDFEVTCNHTAPSGTLIDSNTRTIYELIPSKGTRNFRNFNMGFINSQAHSSSCKITDLVPVN